MNTLNELKQKLKEMREEQERIYKDNLKQLESDLKKYNKTLLEKLRQDLEQHERELINSLKKTSLLVIGAMAGAGLVIGISAGITSYYKTKQKLTPEQAKILEQGEWIQDNNCLLLKNQRVLIYDEKKGNWIEKQTHICIQQ